MNDWNMDSHSGISKCLDRKWLFFIVSQTNIGNCMGALRGSLQFRTFKAFLKLSSASEISPALNRNWKKQRHDYDVDYHDDDDRFNFAKTSCICTLDIPLL